MRNSFISLLVVMGILAVVVWASNDRAHSFQAASQKSADEAALREELASLKARVSMNESATLGLAIKSQAGELAHTTPSPSSSAATTNSAPSDDSTLHAPPDRKSVV